ncbi:MAG: desulfoferrodoxin [Candidatus Sabulitectum sp.]|nr:desulfoferrodoxin [Candidatus Sabulitectum sp.]
MAERMQVYKCERCGNIVEVLHGGPGQLVCCNVDMDLMEEKTADSSTEKHVPVIEKIEGGYKVLVGSVPHPMAEAHYIEWIELLADGVVYRKYLNPGDVAEAIFAIDAENVSAREYCSVHGLWK